MYLVTLSIVRGITAGMLLKAFNNPLVNELR
jgi:hypothetical protein